MSDITDQIYAENPWLLQLGGDIYDIIQQLVLEDTPPASVVQQIRQTDVYKVRFAGMALRQQKGLAAISESEYLQIEDAYQGALRQYGVLSYYSSSEEEWRNFSASLIGDDVSPTEMSRRLDSGYAAVADASPLVKDAFQSFYGVQPTDDALLMYFLDPERGLSEIEQQIAAATIGAAANQYGLNISRTRAELLASEGITQPLATKGYADIARELPQLQSLARIHSIKPLDQTELEQFVFHEDPEVLKKRQQIFQQALNDFRGISPARLTQRGGIESLIDFGRTV